jgi:hypothetical protein
MTKINQYQITIDVLDANTKLRKQLFDVEQQLLEANAKIDDLHIHLEVAAYEAGIEMSDNHKHIVALHDADVIERLKELRKVKGVIQRDYGKQFPDTYSQDIASIDKLLAELGEDK